MEKLKASYETFEFQKNKNNPKDMWTMINKIANFKQSLPPPSELINFAPEPYDSLKSVNGFFADTGPTCAWLY